MNIYRNINRNRIQFDFFTHYGQRALFDDEIESMGGRIYRFTVREDNNLFKYCSEVVLVEDGPITEELNLIIENFRSVLNIKSVKLSNNCGLAVALNEGLKHCNYDLVARMDADDFSLPQRFEKQVGFMEKNLEIVVSSGYDSILLKMLIPNDFFKRRGPQHLRYELKLIKFQRQIGFISRYDFFKNATIRSIVRLSPVFMKKIFYAYVRK